MATQQLHIYLKANYKEYDSNTSRLVSLYSDFAPAKTSNRYGYDANINFWKKLLIDTSRAGLLATHGDVLILETTNLEESFAWKGVGSPMGLACVLEEMQQSEDLVPFDHVMLSSQEGWAMWFLTLLKRPLVWGLRQLSISSGGSANTQQFIVMPTLQDAATRIIKYQSASAVHGITDNLMTLPDFKDKFTTIAVPGAVLSDTDIIIVIRYLQREKGALVVEERGEEMVIKFRNKSDAMHNRMEVTSVDRGIVSIKGTVRSLRKQIEEVEIKITELTTRAKATLQKGQRSQSLFALKQRKQLQALLDRRLASLGTMEEILLKIQSAETDSESIVRISHLIAYHHVSLPAPHYQIMQVYTVGADTLKSVLASAGLTITSVDDAMDQLQDALSDHREIEDAIQATTNGVIEHIVGGDDEELEKELENMVETEKRERERAETQSENARREEAQRVVSEEAELEELDNVLGKLNVMPEVANRRTVEEEVKTEAQTVAKAKARKERETLLA